MKDNLPIVQYSPVNPGGHLHWYPPLMLIHVPPLRQALGFKHSFLSENISRVLHDKRKVHEDMQPEILEHYSMSPVSQTFMY